MRALEKDPEKRFASAKQMAAELQRAVAPASSIDVADWVKETVPDLVRQREAALTQLQRMLAPSSSVPTSVGPFQPAPPPSSSQPLAAPPSSQRLPAPSTNESSANNHTINEYLTRSERDALPPKMPRRVLAALIALPALAVVGVVLVLIVVMRPKTPATADGSKAATSVAENVDAPPASAATTAATPTTATSVDDDAATTSSASSTASAPPVVAAHTTKPKITAPGPTGTAKATGGKKCRIVATPDKSGRMKFEEVCTP
jgi:serine/threonine-protein kinase